MRGICRFQSVIRRLRKLRLRHITVLLLDRFGLGQQAERTRRGGAHAAEQLARTAGIFGQRAGLLRWKPRTRKRGGGDGGQRPGGQRNEGNGGVDTVGERAQLGRERPDGGRGKADAGLLLRSSSARTSAEARVTFSNTSTA